MISIISIDNFINRQIEIYDIINNDENKKVEKFNNSANGFRDKINNRAKNILKTLDKSN
jgi:hypothetical protein